MSDNRNPPPPGIAEPAAAGLTLVVEAGMKTVSARHAGAVIGIGMLVLLVMNPQGLWNWTSRLAANPLSEAVFAVSQAWLDLSERLGLTQAMAALRNAFEYLRNL
jgi:hypothetical protein